MRGMLLAGVVLGWAGAAQAAVITFSGVPAQDTVFTSYSEAGFTVTASSGQIQSTNRFGNPAASLVSFGNASLTVTDGAPFSFVSFDGSDQAYNAVASYTVTGSLAGQQVFSTTFSTQDPGNFTTFASGSSQAIDTLRFDVSGPVSLLDNIVTGPVGSAPVGVPEPASIALLGFGVAGVAGMRRRSARG